MQTALLTIASILAYIGGLFVLVKMTPKLLVRSYDETTFMGLAIVDILAALLTFGSIVVTLILFNGVVIKVFDFVLLLGVLAVAGRLALACFRPRILAGTFRISRMLAGGYCLLLAAAAAFYILQLFVA